MMRFRMKFGMTQKTLLQVIFQNEMDKNSLKKVLYNTIQFKIDFDIKFFQDFTQSEQFYTKQKKPLKLKIRGFFYTIQSFNSSIFKSFNKKITFHNRYILG